MAETVSNSVLVEKWRLEYNDLLGQALVAKAPHLILRKSVLELNLNLLREAEKTLKKLTKICPSMWQGWANQSVLLRRTGRLAEALETARRAFRLNTSSVTAALLADTYVLSGKPNDALKVFEIVGSDRGELDFLISKGAALFQAGLLSEAEGFLLEAILKHSGNERLQYQLSLVQLALGKFCEAWPRYGARWASGHDAAGASRPINAKYELDLKRVNGQMVICGEQGLGDQIFFLRFLSNFTYSPEVVVTIDPRLISLAKISFPSIRFEPLGSESKLQTDFYCFLGDLPLVRPSAAESTFTGGYLVSPNFSANDRSSVVTGDFIGNPNQDLVGLSWRSMADGVGALKSIRLEYFQEFLRSRPASSVICFQTDITPNEFRWLSKKGLSDRLIFLKRAGTDDVYSVIQSLGFCKRVVTVSSYIAHLAGAMSIPTDLYIPTSVGRLWYWYPKNGSCSVLYPSVTVHELESGASDGYLRNMGSLR